MRQGPIPALDGVRGLAVLLVMVHHGVLLAAGNSTVDAFARLATLGWVGVDVFFVLSGFLITGILLETRGRERYFSNFYGRRVLRIFPVYYCFLCFLIFIAPKLGLESFQQAASFWDHQGWYWTYSVNFLAARYPNLLIVATTGHLWSLAVEEQFYCIWPMVVWFLGSRRLLQCCFVLLIVAPILRAFLYAIHAGTAWGYTMLPARVDALAAGALLAVTSRSTKMIALTRRWLPRIGALSSIMIAVVFASARSFGFWLYRVQLLGFSAVVGASAAIVGLLALAPDNESISVRCFETTWLRIIGQRSYALYVIHFPIMHALKRYAGSARQDISSCRARILFTAFAIVVSILLATVSWYFLERPFLRLKRLFSR